MAITPFGQIVLIMFTYSEILDHNNADRNELIEDVEAGTIDVYVHDQSAGPSPGTYWLLADVPPELQRLLSAFPFQPKKGWQYPWHVTQQADMIEDADTGADVLESPIGFMPVKIQPTGDTF